METQTAVCIAGTQQMSRVKIATELLWWTLSTSRIKMYFLL